MRAVLLATLLLALTAPAAAAQVAVEMDVSPREIRSGDAARVTGTVTEDGLPAAGQTVYLEGRRHPFDGDLRVLDSAVTEADGSFAFEREYERNWEVRVRVGVTAHPRFDLYVFPRFELRFEALGGRAIRLVARYRVPHGVDLRRPTIFYVGRRGAQTAPRRATADLERTSSGRYRSVARVRLPARWNGRFRYAGCFRYTLGSGMGDPRAKCPQRFRFSG